MTTEEVPKTFSVGSVTMFKISESGIATPPVDCNSITLAVFPSVKEFEYGVNTGAASTV